MTKKERENLNSLCQVIQAMNSCRLYHLQIQDKIDDGSKKARKDNAECLLSLSKKADELAQELNIKIKDQEEETETTILTEPLQTDTFITDSDSKNLQLVGKGVRELLVLGLDLYTIHFYVSNLKTFDKKNPLDSLKSQDEVLMKMTAVWSVDKKKLVKSAREALERNQVDIERDFVRELLSYLSITAKAGEFFYFKGIRKKDQETLEVKAPGKDVLTLTDKNIINDSFSIWLGNTKGSESLTKLKKQILK